MFTKLLPEYLDDDRYHVLQLTVARNPELGDVIPGTGGFRKARWTDQKRGKGKRGGLRFIYFYFKNENLIWLMTIYGKNEMEELTENEKRILRREIEREKRARKSKRRD